MKFLKTILAENARSSDRIFKIQEDVSENDIDILYMPDSFKIIKKIIPITDKWLKFIYDDYTSESLRTDSAIQITQSLEEYRDKFIENPNKATALDYADLALHYTKAGLITEEFEKILEELWNFIKEDEIL